MSDKTLIVGIMGMLSMVVGLTVYNRNTWRPSIAEYEKCSGLIAMAQTKSDSVLAIISAPDHKATLCGDILARGPRK